MHATIKCIKMLSEIHTCIPNACSDMIKAISKAFILCNEIVQMRFLSLGTKLETYMLHVFLTYTTGKGESDSKMHFSTDMMS